jgi:hypothetical protein
VERNLILGGIRRLICGALAVEIRRICAEELSVLVLSENGDTLEEKGWGEERAVG